MIWFKVLLALWLTMTVAIAAANLDEDEDLSWQEKWLIVLPLAGLMAAVPTWLVIRSWSWALS
jgi:hypothetical protein